LVVGLKNLSPRKPIASDARMLGAPPTELRLALPTLKAGESRTFAVRYAVAKPAIKPVIKPTVKPVIHAARRARPIQRPRDEWNWRQLIPWRR